MKFTREEIKAMSKCASKTKNRYQHYCVKTIDKKLEYISRNNIIRFKELYKLSKKFGYKWEYLGELTCCLKKRKTDEIIFEKCSLKAALKYLRKIKAEEKRNKKNDESRTD